MNDTQIIEIDISNIPEKYSVTDAVLNQLQERYAEFRIDGPEDTEAAKEADKARKRISKLRRETEKTRKELKAPAIAFGRAVDAEAKRIKGVLEPLEAHLSAEYDKYEKAREAIKEAERAAKIKRLLAAGFKFDGTYYVAGDALVHPSQIDDADEAQVEVWEITARKEIERLAEEARRQEEEERQRKAEAARLAKEREELARQRAEIERQRRELEASRPKPAAPSIEGNHKPAAPAHKGSDWPNAWTGNRPAPAPTTQPAAPAFDPWDDGFNTLREAVIEKLRDGTLPGGRKLTRANLIEWIESLKPEQFKLPF